MDVRAKEGRKKPSNERDERIVGLQQAIIQPSVKPAAAARSKFTEKVLPNDSDASAEDDPNQQVFCLLTDEGSVSHDGNKLPKYQELDQALNVKMHARLMKRQTDADPNSFKTEQLSSILSNLSDSRSVLAKYASELDGKVSLPDGASLEHLIQCRIPHKLTIPKKVSGQKIADYLTSSWVVVRYVLRYSSLKRQEASMISLATSTSWRWLRRPVSERFLRECGAEKATERQ